MFLVWAFLALLNVNRVCDAQVSAAMGEVDKLATTNSPYVINGKPGRKTATRGKVFDLDERERVESLVAITIREAEALWPELVDHLSDERHSKVVGIGAGYPRNYSVGDVCQQIIGETLSEPYYKHFPGSKMLYHKFHLPAIAKDKTKLKEWCLKRKGQKLYELQIEACEWAIQEMKSPEISSRDLDESQKREISAQIMAEIESLKKSKSAVLCKHSF